jgi:hypothetical protein
MTDQQKLELMLAELMRLYLRYGLQSTKDILDQVYADAEQSKGSDD